MKNLRRVVWSKGMFLTPQHFQVQDNYFEDNLQFRLGSSLFCNWGVTSLKVDQEALANGTFTLQSCRGIFPDGLTFNAPGSDDLPAGRPIAEFFDPGENSLDAYLVIPEQHPNGVNFAPSSFGEPAGGVVARYGVETVDASDESTGNEQKKIQVARKNLRLLFERQNREGLSTLRIARIVRKDGLYALDPEFIAPCIDISSSDHLMMLTRRLIEILASKSESLSSSRSQRGQDLAEFSVNDTGRFWLLHTVNSGLPELRHIWTARHTHPETLFVAMLRLAGSLSTFVFDPKAREFPDYDHDNLGACFSQLDRKLRNLLDQGIPDKCISIPLQLVGQAIWSGTVTSDEYFKDSQFFLAVGAKMGVDDVIRRVPQLVKISSSDEMQNLIRLALPGITLRHTPTPPTAIKFRMDNQYFSLNQSGYLWDRIRQSRNVSVHVPADITDAKLELLVVLP